MFLISFSYSNTSKTHTLKLCKSKYANIHLLLFMLQNLLQITCDLQRGFQYDQSLWFDNFLSCQITDWSSWKKSYSFPAWPLRDLTRFLLFVNYVTYGFAIRECFLGWWQVLNSFCRSTRVGICKSFTKNCPHPEKLHLKWKTA